MKITAIEHGLGDLSGNFGAPRSPGVHMSDLYNALYAKLEPRRYAKKGDEPPPKERWALGMAFEEMLEEGLKNRACKAAMAQKKRHETVERPGEFETLHTPNCKVPERKRTLGMGCWCGGGIAYSPDLLIYNKVTRVGEIKLNSMGTKGVPHTVGETYDALPQKFDKYFTQMKNYCFHVGTRFARLYSFSIREMVYFNEKRILLPWDIEFTQRELVEEWEWVLNNAREEGLLKKAA
jgi:hypothetical protein